MKWSQAADESWGALHPRNGSRESKNIIDVEGLEHRYGDFIAVNGISFTVKEGEIFSFLGPNGAGKSTAINILITLLRVQKGHASVAGYDIATEPERVRESIGVVFQEVTLDRDMTVWEILEFHGRLYSMPVDREKTEDRRTPGTCET